MKKHYLSNLTDNQYETILGIIGDKRKCSLREIFDAIFYILKTGCQWRMLPADFSAWQTRGCGKNICIVGSIPKIKP